MKCEELQRETKLHAAKVCVITAELLMSLTGRRNSTAGLTHTAQAQCGLYRRLSATPSTLPYRSALNTIRSVATINVQLWHVR